MKLRYDRPRGQRAKRRFFGAQAEDTGIWFNKNLRMWQRTEDIPKGHSYGSSAYCNSVKAFRRMLRKMSKEISCTFVLVSKGKGCDVYGKPSKENISTSKN